MLLALSVCAVLLVVGMFVLFGWYLPREDAREASRLQAKDETEERWLWADALVRYREDGRLDCWCRHCWKDWTNERAAVVFCPNCGNAPAIEIGAEVVP